MGTVFHSSSLTILTTISLGLLLYFIIVTAALLVHCFYNESVALTRTSLLISAFTALASSVTSAVLPTSIHPAARSAVFWISIALIIPAILILKKGVPINKLLIHFLQLILTAGVLLELCVILSKILWEDSVFYSGYAAQYALALPLFVLISLLLYKCFIVKKLVLPFRKFENMLVRIYLSLSVLFHVLLIFVDVRSNLSNISFLLLFWSLKLLASTLLLLTPLFIVKNRQSAYFNEQSLRNESFLEAELVASNLYREAQADTRSFRHDINNHLTAVSMLMRSKNYEKAEEYINTLRGKISALSPKIVTGDEMLDALISSKLPECGRNHIRVRITGVIDGGLGWKPIDTCAVFANAIDNAIEACSKVANLPSREITLSFRKTGYQRIILISNSVAAKVDCTPLNNDVRVTSKADAGNHGYGMRNIRKTLASYGAMMQLSCTDTTFTTTIVMGKQIGA